MNKLLRFFLAATCTCCMVPTTLGGETAYGYLFDSRNGKRGFVSFDMESPQTLNLYKNDYGSIHLSAGEYVDGKIYSYRVEIDEDYSTTISAYDWAVYNAENYSILEKKSMSRANRVVDMTYDDTTNTMYALAENKSNTGKVISTTLCVVDMTTGSYRSLGSPGDLKAIDGYGRPAEDGLITLACDANGQLYAMSHFRTLYKLDKFTGLATPAAPQHKLGTAEQFQSMTFAADGKLWWAQQHPDYAHFCEIDLTTGIPGGFVDYTTDYEKLKKLGDDSQVTALFIKDKQINMQALQAVTDLAAKTADNDPYSVILTWTLPNIDYSGDESQVKGVKIYRIGVSEPLAILDGNATTYTAVDTPNGDATFEVIPFNESGNGFPAFVDVFAGMDQLNAVQNISLTVDDKTTTLKWEKPTSTVSGGYADFDAISYNVYRALGSNEVLVGEGLDKTEFSEIIEKAGGYRYIIEPVCGGVIGKRAESETILITSVASIPYFSGFEDDEDGTVWTRINKNSYYGWQPFGVKSYQYSGKSAFATTGGSSALGDDWLISPVIEFAKGQYIIDFYGNGGTYDTFTLDVCLGTDPNDPESFIIPVLSFANEKVNDPNAIPAGWKHYEAKFNVENAGMYYLGFHNLTTSTYSTIRIDNVSIKSDPAGIDSVENDASNAPAEYYNMQGMKVNNPANGLYIRRQGNKVTKVLIK